MVRRNEAAAKGVKANREYIHALADGRLSIGNSFLMGGGGGKKGDRDIKSITIIECEKNRGLANSLIAGITELTEKYR